MGTTPKFWIGYKADCDLYEIKNAVIVGIEMVDSAPKYQEVFKTTDDYIKSVDTYQYCLAFYDEELENVTTIWLYETLIKESKDA